MSNLEAMKSIHRQRLPGKLLSRTFSHARRVYGPDNVRGSTEMYYHVEPNLGIFESGPFLYFNNTRYSPRTREDKIIQEIMLAPAEGERLRASEVRKYQFTPILDKSTGARPVQIFKRHVLHSPDQKDRTGSEDRDIVIAEAVINPYDRPEIIMHKKYEYSSPYDHGLFRFMSQIKKSRS